MYLVELDVAWHPDPSPYGGLNTHQNNLQAEYWLFHLPRYHRELRPGKVVTLPNQSGSKHVVLSIDDEMPRLPILRPSLDNKTVVL